MLREWARCCDEAACHQLPIAVTFWIIRIVSAEECSSLTQNLMQIRCFTFSVILNVMATQYSCSLNGIYRPHWLVQWSHHCSCMCIPVHSPWLPSYIDISQTVLVIWVLKWPDFFQADLAWWHSTGSSAVTEMGQVLDGAPNTLESLHAPRSPQPAWVSC